MEATQKSASQPESRAQASVGATPLAAAGFLAGIVYMWVEALFRLLFTYNANFDAAYVLWQARVGDIAAMWLTMGGVAVVVFLVFGLLVFRGRARVGSIWVWTILLLISAIVAPLIGEIGTPIGI